MFKKITVSLSLIVVVAASGTSGAGRKPSDSLIGSEVMSSMSAYTAGGVHQHTPEIEQVLSAGAVCMQLLTAALAAGWGANWLSGWASHDATWRESQLGLMPHESIAGIIHIGTETNTPPERPRPDIDAITEWIDA